MCIDSEEAFEDVLYYGVEILRVSVFPFKWEKSSIEKLIVAPIKKQIVIIWRRHLTRHDDDRFNKIYSFRFLEFYTVCPIIKSMIISKTDINLAFLEK